MLLVEPFGVHPLRAVEGFGNGIQKLRNCDIVNVIRHQTICTDHQPIHGTTFGEQVKIEEPIQIIPKDAQAPTASMDNVVRHTRDNNTRFSRHGDNRGGIAKGFLIIPAATRRSKKIIRSTSPKLNAAPKARTPALSPTNRPGVWSTSPNLFVFLSHVFVGAGHDFAHGDAGLDIL
jgi:hypothetical protein